MTYAQITFNPAEKMEYDGADQEAPNPLLQKVMQKFGYTPDGKRK